MQKERVLSWTLAQGGDEELDKSVQYVARKNGLDWNKIKTMAEIIRSSRLPGKGTAKSIKLSHPVKNPPTR
jgi:hypothetical protein